MKVLASGICIGSGGSVGREGPIVQIGSALGSSLGHTLGFSAERIRSLVACGAAGGIACVAGIATSGEILVAHPEESMGTALRRLGSRPSAAYQLV